MPQFAAPLFSCVDALSLTGSLLLSRLKPPSGASIWSRFFGQVLDYIEIADLGGP